MTNPIPQSKKVHRARAIFAAVTAGIDSCVVALALAAGYVVNFGNWDLAEFLARQWKLVAYSLGIFLFLSSAFGLYRAAYLSPFRRQAKIALKSFGLGTLIIFATLFLFRNTYYSQGILLTYLVVLPCAFLLARTVWSLIRNGLHRAGWAFVRAAVFHWEDRGDSLLASDPWAPPGYRIVSDVRIDPISLDDSVRRVIGKDDGSSIQTIVLVAPSLSNHSFPPLFSGFSARGITVRLVTPEVNEALNSTQVNEKEGVVVLGLEGTRMPGGYRILKRFADLVIAASLLLLLSPVLLVVGLAVWIESGTPVLFKQDRGLAPSSARFGVFKFRSMRRGVENVEPSHGVATDGNLLFKSPVDPRVTRVGRLIRKFSLDELPQLFAVLTGVMSLVGPRPLPVDQFTRISPEDTALGFYERRGLVKPGITGLWQISGRSHRTFREMILLDLYYIEHRSILFDLEILAETIPVVLFGRGAY